MRRISDLLFRLRALLTWRRMQRDLDDEVAFHLDMETGKLVRQGMSEAAARRRALRAFGGIDATKERVRDAWGVSLVQDLRADVRSAFRQLRKNPLFSVVAAITLALGIGGTTVIFSVVNGVLLKPLPYRDPDGLVAVRHSMPGIGADDVPLSPATYFTYREASRAFDDIGLYKPWSVTVTGLAQPERLEVTLVTDGVLPILGVGPVMGRGFSAEDVSPGTASPAILSYGFWQRAFGGASDIVGRTLKINGTVREIVGVMPQGFRVVGLDPALYLPLVLDRSTVRIGNYSFPAVARLRPGVTVETATKDVAALLPAVAARFEGKTAAELEGIGFLTMVRPLKEQIVGDVGRVLWVLLGAVGLVLLIACANVANLFLVRAEYRRREMAMRAALGASRGRVIRQLLAESLVLGLVGGAAGLLLAFAAIRVLRVSAPPSLPRLEEIAIDPQALAFALGLAVLLGVLFGLAPGLRHGRRALTPTLGDGSHNVGQTRERHRLQRGFAAAQVALAFVLLVGSGLMVRTVRALLDVRAGFERPEEVLTFRLSLPNADAPTMDDVGRMHEQILDGLEAIPGVSSVTAGTSVAMSPWDSWDNIHVEGREAPGGVTPTRRLNWVAPRYFATLRDPILSGREFTWDDLHRGRPVVMISENLAREYWGEPAQALGQRISENQGGPWREIIGVVANEHTMGVDREAPTVVYFPFALVDFWSSETYVWRSLRYAIRSSGTDPIALLPQVRRAIWSVNGNLPLEDVRTLERIRAASMARTSFALVMLSVAAGLALAIGTVGVFGIVSFAVSRRTREFGVRLAVGARAADITRLVLREGAWVGTVGLVLGLGSALGLTRLLSALLFGVSALDPSTFTGAALGLFAIVLVASYLPAHRAAHTDPTATLRWE